MQNAIQTTHKLDFLARPWDRNPNYVMFRIGTCHGLYSVEDFTFSIIAIHNDVPGNGHFEDVMEWFEYACIRDKKGLRVQELWNLKLKRHLIDKRGFKEIPNTNDVIKLP